MQLVRSLRRWHNKPFKQHYGQDPIEMFFVKALANVLVTCSTILLIFSIFFISLDHSIAQMLAKVSTVGINAVIIVAFVIAYFSLRKGNYNFARDVFVGIIVAGILFSITITGGFPDSNVTQCIIVVPIVVYLFYGMKAGTTIALLTPLVVGLQWLAVKSWGVTLPNVSAGTDKALNLFMVTFIVYLLLVCFVAVFEYRQSILHKELIAERANLSRLVNRDPLTGLHNFRYFHEQLDLAGLKAQQENTVLSLLYLDLNDFKNVNDQYGHCAGDTVLKAVADRMELLLAQKGLLARIGGDEFVILISSQISVSDLDQFQEIILHQISLPVEHAQVKITISASIGSASFPADISDPKHLIEAADRDMYLHKSATKLAKVAKKSRPNEPDLVVKNAASF